MTALSTHRLGDMRRIIGAADALELRSRSEEVILRPCAGTGLIPATSAPGHGSPLPHLHRDRAHPCHICTGTGLAAATSAPELGPPLPHLHRNWAVLYAHAIEGHIRDAVGLAWHEGTISTRVCCKLHLVCCTALSYTRVRMCSAVCAVYSHAWMRPVECRVIQRRTRTARCCSWSGSRR